MFTTATAIVFIIFAEPIISAFSSDPNVINIGARALRAISFFFPFFGFQTIYATLFQALGKGKQAGVLALSRQGIFLIPAIATLPKLFGLTGVIFSQPFADVCTIALTVVFAISIHRELNQHPAPALARK